MDPSALSFDSTICVLGAIASVAILAPAAFRARWSRFAEAEATHVYLGSLLFIIVLWSIRTSLPGAPPVHLLGMGALCLVAGPALALVGGAIVVAVTHLLHDAPLANAGLVFAVQVAVPVGVQCAALHTAQRVLPRNPFAYFFAIAFAGAAASFFAAALAGRVLALTSGPAGSGAVTTGDFAILALLLSFGEATLTGMLITMAVVYRPAWVTTFDDAYYFESR